MPFYRHFLRFVAYVRNFEYGVFGGIYFKFPVQVGHHTLGGRFHYDAHADQRFVRAVGHGARHAYGSLPAFRFFLLFYDNVSALYAKRYILSGEYLLHYFGKLEPVGRNGHDFLRIQVSGLEDKGIAAFLFYGLYGFLDGF